MQLVKGANLSPAQRQIVLNAFPYRWTVDNRQRTAAYGVCPVCEFGGGQPDPTPVECRQYHPTIPLQSDAEWLSDHAFWLTRDGRPAATRHAEPAYMAD